VIYRRLKPYIQAELRQIPAVVLLGPRQSGKTTVAHSIPLGKPAVYLDLEFPLDREKLRDPVHYLIEHENHLVILDEVQLMPDLFGILRSLIDQGRRKGITTQRFLLLGSASADLLRQSETLAGRAAYMELTPLDVLETPSSRRKQLWVRGGFPNSYLALNDDASSTWRRNFIRTYLERDIPQLGPRIPATTLLRFWTMLAHVQGGILNAAQLARGLAIDGKTIARYLDLLVDLMLVRRLQPYTVNAGKRLIRSPKVYIRDSGIVHCLLNIPDYESLLAHPVCGTSWEGFVIETLIRAAPPNTAPLYYRTVVGAEIDLLLEIPGNGLWAIDIKLGLSSLPEKGFHIACDDVKPTKRFVVNSGTERRKINANTELIGLMELAKMLVALW